MFLRDGITGDVGDHVREFIYRNHSILSEIDRIVEIGTHQPINTFDTVVDIAEGSRLFTIAPYVDLGIALKLCRRNLSAKRGRRFFPAASPCPLLAKYVVKPNDPSVDFIILAVVHA
jgi:hypothetical protein